MTCGDAVAGVTSWIINCEGDYPSVYTRVSYFEGWIDARIPGLP